MLKRVFILSCRALSFCTIKAKEKVTVMKSGMRGFYSITTLGCIIGAVVSVLGICLIAIPMGVILSGLIEQIKNRNRGTGRIKGRGGDLGNRENEPGGDFN